MIKPNLNNLKNFIFDFDGVILDSLDTKTNAFYQMYLPHGKDIALKVKRYHIENGGVSRFEKFKYWHNKYLGISLNENDIKKLSDNFSNLVLESIIKSNEIDGAFDFIKKHSKNFNFFIITGTPQDEIEIITNRINLSRYFDEILGSPKNKIEWSKYLKNKYNFIDHETIFIGDAISDYEAAIKNNFYFALRNASYNVDIFKNVKNKIDFKDFYTLEKILCQEN